MLQAYALGCRRLWVKAQSSDPQRASWLVSIPIMDEEAAPLGVGCDVRVDRAEHSVDRPDNGRVLSAGANPARPPRTYMP